MPSTSFASDIQTLRTEVLNLVERLEGQSRHIGLGPPPELLVECVRKLEQNTYQVAVIGEAKRGKSTFINALIGRDILPTNVDIATSQVFRISPSDHEGYRLRFEDDSTQPIHATDLPQYGSQVLADAGEVPRLDQIIRWIEADVPVTFLPPNLRLLDTPGLGTLYAAHSRITYRIVPLCDAVIFVLDSQAPINEQELKFVERLLKVTEHIFFIQTKIDQFARDAWQKVLDRSESLLRDRFGNRLSDMRIWPISSTNLRKAAATNDEDLLMVSRHRELAAALQAFLFRVSGWSRLMQTTAIASRWHEQIHRVVQQRLSHLREESREVRNQIQQKVAQRRREFEEVWGPSGARRQELLSEVQKLARLARQEMIAALQPGSKLECEISRQIDDLEDLDKARKFARSLPGIVIDEVVGTLSEIQAKALERCVQILGPFAEELDQQISAKALASSLPTVVDSARPSTIELKTGGADLWLKSIRNAVFGSAVANSLLGSLGVGAAAPWLVPLVAAIAVWLPSQHVEQQQQLRSAKDQLRRNLQEILQRVRNHVIHSANVVSGVASPLDEWCNGLESKVRATVDKATREELQRLQAELNELMAQAEYDESQRRAREEVLQSQLAALSSIGSSLTRARKRLETLGMGFSMTPCFTTQGDS
ncbi:MAG: dynamin [Pirellulaceae bacterium]|nr:MAG: dynamin [Pirellulaceae bacterium]